jgi:hypothetical protein
MSNFLVWETDSHHNKQTAVLMAVCTSKRQAVMLAVNCLLEDENITTEQIGESKERLKVESQTQGYEINYIIQNVETNKIIE